MEVESLKIIFLFVLLVLIFFIRKNTLLNLIFLVSSIPFETYVNFSIGFTLKPAQLFAFTTFISMILNKDKIFGSLREHIPFLLIILAAILSLINAPTDLIFKGYQGSIRMILNLSVLYFISYILSRAIKTENTLRKIVIAFIIAGFLSTLIELMRATLMEWGKEQPSLFSWLPGGYLRLAPLDMAPNQYAAYLLIVLVFITVYGFRRSLISDSFLKYALPIFFAVIMYAFILTFSRSPWFGYVVALIVILYYTKEDIIKNLIRYTFCMVISLMLLLIVHPKTLKPVLERALFLSIYSEQDVQVFEGSTAERVGRWKRSIEMFLSHPIIGNGWASNLIPHNVFLQILSESGVIGLSAFTIFAIFVLMGSYKSMKSTKGSMRFFAVGIWAGLLGTSIYLMTDIGLYQIQTWFIIGLALAMRHIGEIKRLNGVKKNILIIKIGAIGDLLMATPAIRALKKANPKASISLLVGKSSKASVERNPFLDNLIEVDDRIFYKGSLSEKLSYLLPLTLKIKRENYDVVLVLHRDWRFNLFAFLCGIPERVGFARDKAGAFLTKKVRIEGIKHHIDHYLGVVKLIGVEEDGKEMDFVISSEAEVSIDRIFNENRLKEDDTKIGILAGGAINVKEEMAIRRWPLEYYADLSRMLVAGGYKVILLGADSDKSAAEAILKDVPDGVVDLTGKTTLEETAAVMKRCNVIITHDSGPMHLASTVGVPVISIFGPTNPREKYPLSAGSYFFWKGGNVPCAPCYNEGVFPDCKDPICMKVITVEEVYKKVLDTIMGLIY